MSNAFTNDEVQSRLDDAATPADVDTVVSAMLDAGGAPSYIADDSWWPLTLSGNGHTLEILVAPDVAALGESFRLARLTPYGAQAYVDRFDAILPSKKLLHAIQNASSPKIPFIDVKAAPYNVPLADIGTPKATDDANDAIAQKYESLGLTPGSALTIGYKKAIVVGPNLDGTKVAIAGGMWPDGSEVQPYGTPHPSSYSDYSHGIVLVSRKATLDGSPVDLRMDVFGSTDPNIYGLVSDQGRFDPIFPNAGPNSRAAFGASGSSSSSSTSSGTTVSAPASSSTSAATDDSGDDDSSEDDSGGGGSSAIGWVATLAGIGIAIGIGGVIYYYHYVV